MPSYHAVSKRVQRNRWMKHRLFRVITPRRLQRVFKIRGFQRSGYEQRQVLMTSSHRGGTPSSVAADAPAYRCFVYVLGALDGSRTYVGWTTNVEARLATHNAGKGAKSTRGRQWRVLYTETFNSKSEAMSREWSLKKDRSFRRRLLAGS